MLAGSAGRNIDRASQSASCNAAHFCGGLVGCYAPAISTSWFYRNFYKGLSHEKPIYLLTFNNEITQHEEWLERAGIKTSHAGALMLSKLTSPEASVSWVDHLLNRHGNLWINRFSRLVEPYIPYQWFTSEQTPLGEHEKLSFIEYLGGVSLQ